MGISKPPDFRHCKPTGSSIDRNLQADDVDPFAYLTDVFTRIANGHPNSRIDQLLPWAYKRKDLKAVA
jgi:transposase